MRKIVFILLFIPLFSTALTPVFTCGFECGVSGSVGQHLTNLSGSISTSTVRSGSRSLRMNFVGSSGNVTLSATVGNTIAVMRVAVYFATALPDATTLIAYVNHASTGTKLGIYFNSADSKLYTGISGNLGATGISVTTGQWYIIEFKANLSANTFTVDGQVNGADLAQTTFASTASTTAITCLLGISGITTADVYYDDVLISATTGDYPMGDGYVNHFTLTADGTHNIAGAADFKKGAAGVDITNSTTDSYLLLNDVPLESSVVTDDYINAIAPPNATDYVENKFGPATGISTPTTAPRAVEVIVATHQAATTTGDFKLDLNDNGTVGLIKSQTATAGVTTLKYATKQFATPPTGGTWNANSSGAGAFNNLRVRFYSADAAPDQYFDCAMIEAEFAAVSLTVPGTPSDKRLSSTGVGFQP